MSSQTPPQSLDDEEFVLISEDHHDSLPDFPNFQAWVSRQGDTMTSSSNINPSLSTCLEGVQQQVKMTHQKAYEQNLLLNNISTLSCQLNPGQSDVTPEMKVSFSVMFNWILKHEFYVVINGSCTLTKETGEPRCR